MGYIVSWLGDPSLRIYKENMNRLDLLLMYEFGIFVRWPEKMLGVFNKC